MFFGLFCVNVLGKNCDHVCGYFFRLFFFRWNTDLHFSAWYTNVRFSKDTKVPHSTTNISAIERNFSQCTSLCHFVFSSSEKETLFSKEVVNQSEDYVDAPWSPTHEVECTYRSSSFTFSKNDSLMTLWWPHMTLKWLSDDQLILKPILKMKTCFWKSEN